MDGLLNGAVAVIADDLIWSSRLTEAVRRADLRALPLDDLDELAVALQAEAESESRTIVGAVVDLNGRGYDGVEAIERIRRARLPVIAVAQHDDELTRKRALAAGAMRVFSYDKFHRDGIRLVGRWLSDESTEADPAPA